MVHVLSIVNVFTLLAEGAFVRDSELGANRYDSIHRYGAISYSKQLLCHACVFALRYKQCQGGMGCL